MLDSEGERFWDPQADRACFEAIKSTVNPGIAVVELEHNINDQSFSAAVADKMLAMMNG